MSSLIPFFFPMLYRWKFTAFVAVFVIIVGAVLAGHFWGGGAFSSKEMSGVQSVSARPGLPLPTREEETELVGGTMRAFAQTLLQKDFAPFYKSISAAWQKQVTVQDIAAAFEHFIPFAREVQTAVTSADPFFNAPPSISGKNVLTLRGFYRIEGTKMLFDLQYIRERDAWKLFGMDLRVK